MCMMRIRVRGAIARSSRCIHDTSPFHLVLYLSTLPLALYLQYYTRRHPNILNTHFQQELNFHFWFPTISGSFWSRPGFQVTGFLCHLFTPFLVWYFIHQLAHSFVIWFSCSLLSLAYFQPALSSLAVRSPLLLGVRSLVSVSEHAGWCTHQSPVRGSLLRASGRRLSQVSPSWRGPEQCAFFMSPSCFICVLMSHMVFFESVDSLISLYLMHTMHGDNFAQISSRF